MILEVGDMSGIVVIVFIVLFLPPILLITIGLLLRKKYKELAVVFYILAVLYLLIGIGLCFGGF